MCGIYESTTILQVHLSTDFVTNKCTTVFQYYTATVYYYDDYTVLPMFARMKDRPCFLEFYHNGTIV
jgi:hypothetical protein